MQPFSIRRIRRLIRRLGLRGLVLAGFYRYCGRPLAHTAPKRTRQLVQSFLGGAADGRPPFVLVSTHDWEFPFDQRAHHLARALAEIGWKVIYVSPSTGYDHWAFSHRAAPGILCVNDLDAVLDVADSALVYVHSADFRFTPALFETVRARGGHMVYDYLDALDEKVANVPMTAEHMCLHEKLLADEAGCLCIATADDILADVRKVRSGNFGLVTNGVDRSHFAAERSRNGLGADLAAILDRSRPVAGYYGALATWFDYDLVKALAAAAPDIEVVLIGPDYDGSRGALEERPENLHVLDPVAYDDLPRHAAWFDVAMVPFAINEITNATSPLKLFEYMALGRPIVSTAIPEARKYRSVFVAETQASFIDHVVRTCRDGSSEDKSQLLAAEAAENDWLAKAREIDVLIGSAGWR